MLVLPHLINNIVKLTLIAVVIFVLLQLQFFFGNAGFFQWQDKQKVLADQQQEQQRLIERRQQLQNRLSVLKDNPQAYENIVRRELGKVKANEVWYHIVASTQHAATSTLNQK